MDRHQLILGICFTILSVMLLFWIIPNQVEPPIMSVVPAEMYPIIGTIILLIGGIGLIFNGVQGENFPIVWEKVQDVIRFIGVMSILLSGTLLLYQYAHFLVGSAFLIAATMWTLGEKRLLQIGAVAILSPAVIWFLVHVLLERPLP